MLGQFRILFRAIHNVEAPRLLFILTVAALLLLPARTAHSESPSGWLLAAKIGHPTLEADFSESFFQAYDDTADAWGVGAGYRFGRHLSVETWYQDLGDFDGGGGLCPPTEACPSLLVPSRASLEAISLRLVGHLAVGRRLELYVFAGPIDWTLDVERLTSEDVRPLPRLEISDTDIFFGAGLEIALRSGLSAFAEYDRFDLDVAGPWLGLRWRF